MKVYINHDFKYEVEHLIKTFDQEIIWSDTPGKDVLENTISYGDIVEVSAKYNNHFSESIALTGDVHVDKRLIKRANARVIYDLLVSIYNKTNPWGTLVGVRPAKLVHALFEEGLTVAEVHERLYQDHRIEQSKRQLLIDVVMKERKYLDDVQKRPLSLYLCIPFCPTRCLYCSFPSNDLKKKGKLVEPYLTSLLKEIDANYRRIKKANRQVDCIYIGGGTPSILTAEQFERLLGRLDQYFDLPSLKEFTIEAGRPDTITAEKLAVWEAFHVSRLCLNPQTMNNKTLGLIGRSHTVGAIKETFSLIRQYKFRSINMDLILGLPDEDLDDVQETLDAVVALGPENITIHTLAVKTSSRLKDKLAEYDMTQSEMVEEMLRRAEKAMASHDYYPYYMYRQKNMVGNFENVGYAKTGFESLYNMRIIEEQHDILALGAGAVSKLCFPDENRFQRIANIKGIEEYLERLDDVIEKQKTFFE